MPSELLTSREGSTLILTLSDPATRNTLSPQVYSAGVEALNVAGIGPTRPAGSVGPKRLSALVAAVKVL